MSRKDERMTAVIAHEAANFIAREAQSDPLITVTRAAAGARADRITVFVSVFPAEKTAAALSFLDRRREAFSDYLKSHARLGPLPRVEFLPESGEGLSRPAV